MTPAEMLAPQPDPVRRMSSVSVTSYLVGRLPELVGILDAGPVAELLELRRRQGIERYGAELMTYNGRNATADALQEFLDGALYLAQDHLDSGESLQDLVMVLELVARLRARLEQAVARG